jgi:short-subunit dehydrogenase
MPFERHVVISGAGKGIGREMALHLAGTGRYVLHLVSRTATTLDATVTDCLAAGAKVHRYVADLTSAEAVNGIHWDFQESIPIALVNNAGGYLGKSLESTTPEELQQQLNQNLFAAFHLTNALLDNLRRAGDGRVLTIGSIAAVDGLKRGGAYAASKHALRGWSASLRKELASQGIAVSLVNIGPTWSSSWEGSGMDPDRIVDPKDVALMVETLLRLSHRSVVEEVLVMPAMGDL